MGVKIYTIGVGTRGAAPMPVRHPLTGRRDIQWVEVSMDEDTLKAIAAKTGGKYFRATDTESLAAIYREIDQLEKTNVESRHFVDYRELAIESANLGSWKVPPLVLLALLLLAGRVTLSNTIFRELG
jgi:Ca-activated chloride channel family protein